jgi:hypothetical protein
VPRGPSHAFRRMVFFFLFASRNARRRARLRLRLVVVPASRRVPVPVPAVGVFADHGQGQPAACLVQLGDARQQVVLREVRDGVVFLGVGREERVHETAQRGWMASHERARAELAVRVRLTSREVVAERVAVVGAPAGHLQGDLHVERAKPLGSPVAKGPRLERARDEQGRLGVRPPRGEEGVHGGRAKDRDLQGGAERARRGRRRRGGPHRRGVEARDPP